MPLVAFRLNKVHGCWVWQALVLTLWFLASMGSGTEECDWLHFTRVKCTPSLCAAKGAPACSGCLCPSPPPSPTAHLASHQIHTRFAPISLPCR